MTSFPLPVKAEIADSLMLSAKILQLGDGYEQLRSDGLNQLDEVWDITVIIPTSSQSAILQAFLIQHGQHKLFKWQSPRDTSPKDYAIEGKVSGTKRNGGGNKPVFFTRQMRFRRAFDRTPVVPPPPPITFTAITYLSPS